MLYILLTQTCCLSNASTAMQRALEELGFGPCYHMRTAMNQYPRDCAMWLEALEAKYDGRGTFEKKQWDQLLGHCSVSFRPQNSCYAMPKHLLTTSELPASPYATCQP